MGGERERGRNVREREREPITPTMGITEDVCFITSMNLFHVLMHKNGKLN